VESVAFPFSLAEGFAVASLRLAVIAAPALGVCDETIVPVARVFAPLRAIPRAALPEPIASAQMMAIAAAIQFLTQHLRDTVTQPPTQ
jgi:hypothetical protein